VVFLFLSLDKDITMKTLDWEVFDPRDGKAIVTTHSQITAEFLAIRWDMDYAEGGEGWL
jgi:hypothetical protein